MGKWYELRAWDHAGWWGGDSQAKALASGAQVVDHGLRAHPLGIRRGRFCNTLVVSCSDSTGGGENYRFHRPRLIEERRERLAWTTARQHTNEQGFRLRLSRFRRRAW